VYDSLTCSISIPLIGTGKTWKMDINGAGKSWKPLSFFLSTPSSVRFVNCAVLQQSRKRHVIGYFDSDAAPDYKTYHKVASILRDDCSFHAAIGSAHFSVHTTHHSRIFTV